MGRPMISQDLWRHQPMKWKVLPPPWESVRGSSDTSDDISVPWIVLSKIQITPYLTQNLPQPQQHIHSSDWGHHSSWIDAPFLFWQPQRKIGKTGEWHTHFGFRNSKYSQEHQPSCSQACSVLRPITLVPPGFPREFYPGPSLDSIMRHYHRSQD